MVPASGVQILGRCRYGNTVKMYWFTIVGNKVMYCYNILNVKCGIIYQGQGAEVEAFYSCIFYYYYLGGGVISMTIH